MEVESIKTKRSGSEIDVLRYLAQYASITFSNCISWHRHGSTPVRTNTESTWTCMQVVSPINEGAYVTRVLVLQLRPCSCYQTQNFDSEPLNLSSMNSSSAELIELPVSWSSRIYPNLIWTKHLFVNRYFLCFTKNCWRLTHWGWNVLCTNE